MKRKGFNGYVNDFSVDYDAIVVDDILDIHKDLMKKNNMIQKCKSSTYFSMLFGCSLPNVSLLKCISMTNQQQYKAGPKTVNVNSDEPVFYPVNIKTSKSSGSCNKYQ